MRQPRRHLEKVRWCRHLLGHLPKRRAWERCLNCREATGQQCETFRGAKFDGFATGREWCASKQWAAQLDCSSWQRAVCKQSWPSNLVAQASRHCAVVLACVCACVCVCASGAETEQVTTQSAFRVAHTCKEAKDKESSNSSSSLAFLALAERTQEREKREAGGLGQLGLSTLVHNSL